MQQQTGVIMQPLTAAEFKRMYCNKAARTKAAQQMEIRTNLGVLVKEGVQGALKAKNKLNDVWINRDMRPAKFHRKTKPTAVKITKG